MTDLTVLISPTPLHIPIAKKNPFSFRRSSPCLITPVMVTLETERAEELYRQEEDVKYHENPEETDTSEEADASTNGGESTGCQPPQTTRRGRTSSRTVDPNLLSPPINTWKSSTRKRPKHKPSRSQSAPPGPIPPSSSSQEGEGEEAQLLTSQTTRTFVSISPSAAINNFNYNRALPRRSFTSFSETSSSPVFRRNGDLLPPPPPLLRPTTFWRKTRRSGVTAASFSPSYHLIRRSTFIAAGLDLDTPSHDLRAYSVENRVGFIVVPPDDCLL